MKKFLASILALCLLCSSGIFGIRAFAGTEKTEIIDDSAIHDDSRTDSDNYTDDGFVIAPHIILNQETNCYDIDIYVTSSNKYFSNFEAEIDIYYDGENSKTPKLSIEQYATGNFTAGITKNMDTGTTLNIVFNAPKNVDMSAGYVVNNLNYENVFLFKLATIKTDIKQNVIKEGSELDSSATVISMGFYAEGGEVKTAGFINGNKVISFAETHVVVTSYNPVLPGDYDFDGVLTVKDLIAAQYYLTNHMVYFEEEFLMRMLNSTSLQYLQMYLCETISFSDYIISLYENAGMIEEKWYECDTYWDYDYWGDEDFPTDEQGYKYLGEDRYGNYHVWNEKQGVKFFVKMSGCGFAVHFYEIDENGKICNLDCSYKSFFGDEMFYMGSEQLWQFKYDNPSGKSWYDYWDEANLDKRDSDDVMLYQGYEYKGTDKYGNKHYWNKTTGFKFFIRYECAFRYLISSKDNRLLIVSYEEKWGL